MRTRADRPLLYHHPLSFDSQIVRLCAAEKGVRLRRRAVDALPGTETFDPWFVALNPAMRVPLLLHGTRTISGAEAICRYLDGAFEGPLLDHRNEAQPWIDLALGLPVELLSYARAGALGRRDLRRRFRKLESRAETNPPLAPLYAQRAEEVDRLARDLAGPAGVAAARRQIEVLLDRADAALAHRPYLTGEGYTLADAVWTVLLARLALLGYGRLWAPDVRPTVAEWWRRVRARPSVRKAGVRTRLSPLDLVAVPLRSAWVPLLRALLAAALVAAAVWAWTAAP
jgi:tetrachloro-p-hydroquinone reductive dehalogenase